MTGNDWLVIQYARKRREGVRVGAWLAGPIGVALGIAVMAAVHIGLSMYADRKHEEVVALMNTKLATCSAEKAQVAGGFTAGWQAAEENRLKERR